jgi:hypothetical protein
MEQQILANAELVRTVAREQLAIAVGFEEAGVRWLDRYIDGLRTGANESTKEKLPSTLGSYLGECIRQSFGGTWIEDKEYGWAVKINQQVTVFPFSKVRKQLSSNAEGESVLGLYTSIPALLGEQITTASPLNKR